MGRSILFLILLFVFPLSACSHKSSAPVSADTMPDMEELLAYSQSHSQEEYEKKLKEIQAVIDNTSYEELCQILTDSLASWADTQTDYEITDTSIEFSEDPLLMDEQRKEKLYNNWTVSVNIQLAGDEKSKYDVPDAAAIYRQAADALRSTPYGAYKLHTLKITASSDPDRILTSEQEGRFFLTDSAFSLPQEPEELAIQKTVLEQVEEFNQEYFSDECYRGQNVTLKRFGSPRDSSVLYLEFPIYAPPFDQDMAAFADSLEKTVTGDVKLMLYKGNMINAGVTSPFTLYDEQTASFGVDKDYDQSDATGFINLFGLSIKERAKLSKSWPEVK